MLTILFAIASTALLGQFSSFNPSFDGELWGVRHELTPGGGARTAGVAFLNGTLLVADPEHRTVIAYDNAGQVVSMPAAAWDATDPLSPVFGLVPHQLAAVVINVNGTNRNALLISDAASNRVAAFDATGDHLFTVRLQRPIGTPTVSLSIGQMAMSPGSRFNLTTAMNTLTLTGSFAAAWAEQEITGRVNSGAFVFTGASSTLPHVLTEYVATPTFVLDGTETNPVAPAAAQIFGVTFDTVGNLYVLDAFTERLHVYGPDLSRLFTFGTPVTDGTSAEFHEPWGMAFWPDASGTSGRLFINDTYNSRILIYRPVDGLDVGTVIDSLQFESVIKNFVASESPIELFSIALDPASGTIAVTDFAELSEHPVPRIVVLQKPRLATFNFQVLNAANDVVDSVCTAADYKIRFSLTVPAGLADVTGVTPHLTIAGVPTGASPTGATFPTTLTGGQVATYTYALTAPGTADDDIAVLAGAAATNTTDILVRSEIISLSDCAGETDPSTITAAPSTPPQVSGWTPMFNSEGVEVTLTAQDDDGIKSIHYKLSGANRTGDDPVESGFDGIVSDAEAVVLIPDPGRTTLSYRVRDGNAIWSAWQTLDVRTKPVINRLTNENTSVEFRVGDPEGTGVTYSVQGLPTGVTFSTATGQFAGVISFDAVQPHSSDPALSSGVFPVVVTETGAGGATSSVGFTWTVNHINREPIMTKSQGPATSIQQGRLFQIQINGFDPDDDPALFTVRGMSSSGRDLPQAISIDPVSGLISGIFPLGSDADYDIVVGLAECAVQTPDPPCNTAPLAIAHLATLFGFSVAVLDANLPPDILNPGPQSSAAGASVTLPITATDAEGDTLIFQAGGLPAGLSISSSTGVISGTVASPAAGNYAVTVTVDDQVNRPIRSVTFAWKILPSNVPPVCTAAAVSPGLLWPPNHKPRYITIGGVVDPDGGVPTVKFTSVLQDEPTNTQGDGDTTQDAGIENNGAAGWVRAERLGGEDGRVYILGFTARDAQGASCSGTVFVGVPHDRGNHNQPIPSPGRWNSITGALVLAPPPNAVNDSATTRKSNPVVIAVQSNDVVYGAVTLSIASAPGSGTATVTPGGTVAYTPVTNWTGTTSFTYRLTNGTGSDTAVVTITVKK